MGSGVTTLSCRSDAAWNLALHMMPHFYTKDPATPQDVAHLRSSWGLITTAKGYYFQRLMDKGVLPLQPCLSWFYNVFFERLKYIAPHCSMTDTSDLFANAKILIHIMLLLQEVCDPMTKKFRNHIQKLYLMMSSRNLTFYDMGIFGDVFFYALQYCLHDDFPAEVRASWTRLYSALLFQLLHQMRCTSITERVSSKSVK